MTTFWREVGGSICFVYETGGVTVVPPMVNTPWRNLPSNILIHHDGEASRITFEDGSAAELPDGGAVFVPYGKRHFGENTSRRPHVSRWAHFRVTVFGALDLFQILPMGGSLPAHEAVEAGGLCEVMAGLDGCEEGLADIVRLQQLGFALLEVLARSFTPGGLSGEKLAAAQRLAPVLRSMTEHPEQVCTTQGLCRILAMSSSRVHELFHEVTGLPPMKHLQRIRLARAQQLLATTSLPVQEVGERVGYGDPFHFSRLFTRNVGMCPSLFRARSAEHGAY